MEDSVAVRTYSSTLNPSRKITSFHYISFAFNIDFKYHREFSTDLCTAKGKICTLDFNRCCIFQLILLIWISPMQVAREWNIFTFTKRIEYERRFKIGQTLACVIQSFSHWPIEIKVHNMRIRGTTHSKQSAHEKNGKRMLMNGVFKKAYRSIWKKRMRWASLRTTFAQQIESAVTYSAPSNNVNERVWFYFSSLNSGAGALVLNAHPMAFYFFLFGSKWPEKEILFIETYLCPFHSITVIDAFRSQRIHF